jgi:energy-coupling factor transporter transmembrane protein EcfT
LYKQQDVLLELYKHHLKVLLEANVFIYAVTGAIASFVITHSTLPHVRWILWLPAIVCILFAVFFFIVSTGFNYTDQDLGAICNALNIETYPRIQALPIALRVSGVLLILIGALLIVGFCIFQTAGCLLDAV